MTGSAKTTTDPEATVTAALSSIDKVREDLVAARDDAKKRLSSAERSVTRAVKKRDAVRGEITEIEDALAKLGSPSTDKSSTKVNGTDTKFFARLRRGGDKPTKATTAKTGPKPVKTKKSKDGPSALERLRQSLNTGA